MNKGMEKIAHNCYTRDNLCIGITLDFGKNHQNVDFTSKNKKMHLIDKTIMVKSLNETSQKQFTALRLREEFPPCSILIFSMGSVIIVGLRKLGLTPLSVLQAVSAIADTQEHPITIANVEIVNVVSTFNLFKLNFLDLKEFFRKNKIAYTHVPDSFPGLFFKVLVPIRHLKKGETIGGYYTQAAKEREAGNGDAVKKYFRGKTVLIFQVGKCTILGACGGDDIHVIFKMLFGFFWYFIDKSVHLTDDEFENGKCTYHLPPLSWYLMTDFFLRTVPGYQYKPSVVLANLISENYPINRHCAVSNLPIAINRLVLTKDCMLRQTVRENPEVWFLNQLQVPIIPLLTKAHLKKHTTLFEKELAQLSTVQEKSTHRLTVQQCYKQLLQLHNLTQISRKLEETLLKNIPVSDRAKHLFESFEEYLPVTEGITSSPESLKPKTLPQFQKQQQYHYSQSMYSKEYKGDEIRSKHKMRIQRLNQLEEIYDLVTKIAKEGRCDEIAKFLGVDSYIISGLLNKNVPIPIKESSIFSKDYTHMTPAQAFFNKGLYNKYGQAEVSHESRRGILDFMIDTKCEYDARIHQTTTNNNQYDDKEKRKKKDSEKNDNVVVVDDDDEEEEQQGTKIYLDVQAIENFLKEQVQHGIIFAPLSNYRTQHHQSLQTRLILEDIKRKTNCHQPSFSLDQELLNENSFYKKSENIVHRECCECKLKNVNQLYSQILTSTNKMKRNEDNMDNMIERKRKKIKHSK
uniref:Wsv303-like protein n=1 Tax=Marsupenaeus japonicus endogenous nimavirus TaxID=2133793 RepID=A0A401IP68_9VIRU|nr:wsv303-like protein [Marsupenaeus japonicus endogenous nimavirus]